MKTTPYIPGLLTVIIALTLFACSNGNNSEMLTESPNGNIDVTVEVLAGVPKYSISRNDTAVLTASALGVVMEDQDFSKGLELVDVSESARITETFTMVHGKRTECRYEGNEKVFHFKNGTGTLMDIIFRVSDDGVAFRYSFPGKTDSLKTIARENTSFHFPAGTTAFLQPMQEAKSGWSKVNPCYEEFYEKEIPAGTPSPTAAGWVYPALFHHGNLWVLITETALGQNYCGTRLMQDSPDGEYFIGFPEAAENFHGGELNPQSTFPWQSPWRVLAIGTLQTIVESDLGVALANKPADADAAWIKPGHSSWSWPLLKDDSITYPVQKKFIDFAADMQWNYCLIDVNWDTKIGYDKMAELVKYAAAKNVGVILWYNSSGDWNETTYTPKSKLLTPEDRMKEFARLKEMGVAGMKIDFFGGDGQSVIDYYIDILEDAAQHKLLVNFHGSTIPRGWHRTYPHLMSMEAIKGFEYVTFDQRNADEEPSHCTMLPFTRNAFDPMDFTPLSLDSVPRIARRTTPGFELALSVLFLSGIQHFVEKPEGMKKASPEVKGFLRTLPTRWDDSKFISGYPGKDVVIARRSGEKWFIAGINGENNAKTFKLDLSFAKDKQLDIINDADEHTLASLKKVSLPANGAAATIEVRPNGGFVIVAE